jgi:membrane protease subunit (stomatin/prohibitin family)
MKQIAQAAAAANKALTGGDAATATTNVEILATQFATIETFYTQRSKPDAVKLAQTARSGAADTLAALKAGDTMKAQMALANTQGTCKQCHGMYREQDPTTKLYKFNAASGITAP